MIRESQKRALDKYIKKTMKPYSFRLHKEKYKDIIEWLDSKENKTQYILDLIKKDMNEREESRTCR